jgi:hypothetical protein
VDGGSGCSRRVDGVREGMVVVGPLLCPDGPHHQHGGDHLRPHNRTLLALTIGPCPGRAYPSCGTALPAKGPCRAGPGCVWLSYVCMRVLCTGLVPALCVALNEAARPRPCCSVVFMPGPSGKWSTFLDA